MKKTRKSMELESLRIYEEMMRKRLLNNLSLYIAAAWMIALAAPLRAATDRRPTFLILNDGISVADEADRLESMGAFVGKRVPPSILVADLPPSVKPRNLANVKNVYTTPIALAVLEPMGPLAVAAGMEWNRQQLTAAQSLSVQSLGAMRALVAEKSLPSPTTLQLEKTGHALRVAWGEVEGASAFEIELAKDPQFTDRFIRTNTVLREARVAAPEGTGPLLVYARVRGVDRFREESGNITEVFGVWSKTVSLSVTAEPVDQSLPVPVLSSPLADYRSVGTSIILEWGSSTAPEARVQVSASRNFSTTIFDATLEGREFVCPSPLLHVGDKLYWRIRAWGDMKSPWSDPRAFTIGEPRHEAIDMFINPEAPK